VVDNQGYEYLLVSTGSSRVKGVRGRLGPLIVLKRRFQTRPGSWYQRIRPGALKLPAGSLNGQVQEMEVKSVLTGHWAEPKRGREVNPSRIPYYLHKVNPVHKR
jgi:hypothetical protein